MDEPQRRPEDRAALRDSQPPSLGRNTHSLWGGAKWEKEESNAWFIGFIGPFRAARRGRSDYPFLLRRRLRRRLIDLRTGFVVAAVATATTAAAVDMTFA